MRLSWAAYQRILEIVRDRKSKGLPRSLTSQQAVINEAIEKGLKKMEG
jgi:hypothetical protein